MDCPYCGAALVSGRLAVDVDNPAGARVAWKPDGRRRAGSQTVLRPGAAGDHTRPARWCRICEALLVAPLEATEDPD